MVAHHTFLVHLLGLEFANCEVMELELFHESRTYRVLTARAEPKISTKGGRNRSWMGRSPVWSTCDKDDHDAARIQEGPTMPVWYAPVNKHGEQPGLTNERHSRPICFPFVSGSMNVPRTVRTSLVTLLSLFLFRLRRLRSPALWGASRHDSEAVTWQHDPRIARALFYGAKYTNN